MDSNLRRSKRKIDYLPIVVNGVDSDKDEIIAGPFSGRIIDISANGACLLMTQVMRNNYHIFHSTREKNSNQLQLNIAIPPEIATPIVINAFPIWLSIFRKNEISAFKMGIEFILSPEDQQMKKLQQAMLHHQKKRGNWWTESSKNSS